MSRVLEADLTWTGERFERGVQVAVADGRIASVGAAGHVGAGGAAAGTTTERLPGRALLPGFVNAHSHAFQRGLRGRGERFPAGAGSFWSWREAMYGLVREMDADRLYELSRRAYEEMLATGITCVGEFHYLHHDASGAGWALDDAVLAAARDAGIRLVLLQAHYATGGIGRPLEGAQLRFRSGSPADYFAALDRLAGRLDPATQSLGCVVHSIRAASLADLEAVHAGARRRGLVLHVHLEEQRREIEECVAAHGRTPARLLLERLELDGSFTAVHATHTAPEDLAALLERGVNLCICPLTEASLGDGLAAADAWFARGAHVAVGTDSNARIDFLEELRWLELAQRLARERRGACVDGEGQVARPLLRAATAGGARSLGLEAGALRPGALADLVAVDLSADVLAGWDDEHLLDALVLGAGGREVVADVWVGGRRVRGASS